VSLAFGLAFLSGFVALSHEIIWYRVLSFTTGGAADAFALMLGAYLLGIALGSAAARALCRDGDENVRAVPLQAVSYLFAASALAFLVPPAIAGFVTVVEAWQITLPLVVAAAGLLGAVFPLVSHATIPPDARSGGRIAFVYFANILGAAAGSLGTGFWLLDFWPLWRVALSLALLSLAAAGLLAVFRESPGRRLAAQLAAFAGLGLAFAVYAPALYGSLYEKLQFKGGYRPGEAFAHVVENKSGVITVTADGSIYGGGSYDGGFNTSLRSDTNGIVRAYAVAGLHPRPREVLMIGLSSGSWAAVIADHPGVERLTIVEINPGYLQLLPRYPIVSGLLKHPKVRIEIGDGRRWLVRNRARRFDAIISNTTAHWRANVTNLLSAEFLELVKSRLREGGVFYFNTTGSERAVRTATQVFPHTLRFANFVACSEAALSFDAGNWRRMLENYVVGGERVVEPDRAGDRRLLDALGASLRHEWLETDESLRARSAGLVPITDDNMGTEWGR